MLISKEILHDVADGSILTDNIKNSNFNWHDIVAIPQRPKKPTSSLYYATHSTGKDGWDNGFDRSPNIPAVLRDTRWDVITDNVDITGDRIMNVSDMEEFVTKVYNYDKNRANPTVVGITGSVGKTTTVALLEHIARSNGTEVVRFYSKRLTPLSVATHFINRVKESTKLIVMEYSAYLPNHVSKLAKILKPDLAFLMNIYSTHINPGSFSNENDIFKSKIKIKGPKTIAHINKEVCDNLSENVPPGWTPFDVQRIDVKNKHLPPTKRTAEMLSIGKIFKDFFNISDDTFIKACETFKPKENRIILCQFNNAPNIFFHGETSGGSRLKSWFEITDQREPNLFVEEVNFADEDPKGFHDILKEIFSNKNTVVLDTKSNREKINVDANFVSRYDFENRLHKLPKDAYVIYHKALSTRIDGFEPKKHISDTWNLN